MAGHSAEEIKKETRVYILVFVALAVLTLITVGIASLDLGFKAAVGLALLVASIKGSLVACYFMHLIDEKKLIYSVLLLTLAFFIFLMVLPLAGVLGSTGT